MKVEEGEREIEAVRMRVRVRGEGERERKRFRERESEKDIISDRLCERGLLRVSKRNIGRQWEREMSREREKK